MDHKTDAGKEFQQLIAQFPTHDLSKLACTELQHMGLRCAAPTKAPAKRVVKK
jgi:hypothetical protein